MSWTVTPGNSHRVRKQPDDCSNPHRYVVCSCCVCAVREALDLRRGLTVQLDDETDIELWGRRRKEIEATVKQTKALEVKAERDALFDVLRERGRPWIRSTRYRRRASSEEDPDATPSWVLFSRNVPAELIAEYSGSLRGSETEVGTF